MYKSSKQNSTSHSKIKQLGQGMTEYIIIVAVIAVAAIGAFGYFGDAIQNQVAGLAGEVSGGTADAGKAASTQAAADALTAAATHKSLSNYNSNSQGGTAGGQ